MVGETRWVWWGKHLLVVAVAVLVLLPVYWMVNMSFKTRAEFVARPPTLVVQAPTTENYYDLLITQRFYRFGLNSLVVAVIAATIAVVVGTMAAYALSRYRLPRNFNYHLLFTVLTVRMFPPIVSVIPLFVFFNQEILGYKLLDTRLGLGLVHAFLELPLVIWMMIGFFRDIPRDMEEAALVDGDSRLAVLRKIAIPLAAPGLAATFILVFISSWNEFLMALILTQSRAQTLPIAVAGQITQYDIKWGNMMAAGVVTTVPVLLLALAAQRHLTRGLALGGVTG
ncbi:MAG: carbohydrate ABC transporter permease [Chloroflexia bacterium]|nr:carbohydrate ABC transporter permease [Chloroflexia bacterium]